MNIDNYVKAIREKFMIIFVFVMVSIGLGFGVGIFFTATIASSYLNLIPYVAYGCLFLVVVVTLKWLKDQNELSYKVFLILAAIYSFLYNLTIGLFFGVNNTVYDGFAEFNLLTYIFLFYITSTLFASIGFIFSFQLFTSRIATSNNKFDHKLFKLSNQLFGVLLFCFAIIYFAGYIETWLFIVLIVVFANNALHIWSMQNDLLVDKINRLIADHNSSVDLLSLELFLISLIAPIYIWRYRLNKLFNKEEIENN